MARPMPEEAPVMRIVRSERTSGWSRLVEDIIVCAVCRGYAFMSVIRTRIA